MASFAVKDRPGVEVEQQFVGAGGAAGTPILPACIVGIASQIEENEEAGPKYTGSSIIYSYPNLKVGAEVDVTKVTVTIDTDSGPVESRDTYDITTGVTISTSTVTVPASLDPSKEILGKTQVTIAAGTTLRDNNTDFFNVGGAKRVQPGDKLTFILASVLKDAAAADADLTFYGGSTDIEVAMVSGGSEAVAVVGNDITITYVASSSTGGSLKTLVDGDTAASALVSVKFDGDGTGLWEAGDASALAPLVAAEALANNDSIFSRNIETEYVILDVQQNELTLDKALIVDDKVEYKITRFGSNSGIVKVSYVAKRTDLKGALLEINNTSDIETLIGTIDPDNELGYGVSIAVANTNLLVFATAVNDDTLAEYTEALEFLEAQAVYGIVVLTEDTSVHALLKTHAEALSAACCQGERVGWIAPAVPDKTVFQTSSTTGATHGTDTNRFTDAAAQFITNNVPVGALLKVPGGIDIDGGTETEVVILSIESETEVEVVGVFDAQGDGPFTYTVESRDFTKSQKAINVAVAASGYASRRIRYVQPPVVKFSVDGVETNLPGYFAACGLAGQRSGFTASQGLTNMALAGPTGLVGSNDTFNKTHLGIMAGGGAWILVQDAVGGPVVTRHQLTTDLTSTKTQEDSVVSAIDFFAKFIRAQMSPLVGRHNLTQDFLENQFRPSLQGTIDGMVQQRIIGKNTSITSIAINPSQTDQVLATIDVEELIPGNFFRITLVI